MRFVEPDRSMCMHVLETWLECPTCLQLIVYYTLRSTAISRGWNWQSSWSWRSGTLYSRSLGIRRIFSLFFGWQFSCEYFLRKDVGQVRWCSIEPVGRDTTQTAPSHCAGCRRLNKEDSELAWGRSCDFSSSISRTSTGSLHFPPKCQVVMRGALTTKVSRGQFQGKMKYYTFIAAWSKWASYFFCHSSRLPHTTTNANMPVTSKSCWKTVRPENILVPKFLRRMFIYSLERQDRLPQPPFLAYAAMQLVVPVQEMPAKPFKSLRRERGGKVGIVEAAVRCHNPYLGVHTSRD